MNKNVFLENLIDNLELESVINFNTHLTDLPEWDSLTAMVLIGFFSDNFDVTINADDIQNMTDINSILQSKNIVLED